MPELGAQPHQRARPEPADYCTNPANRLVDPGQPNNRGVEFRRNGAREIISSGLQSPLLCLVVVCEYKFRIGAGKFGVGGNAFWGQHGLSEEGGVQPLQRGEGALCCHVQGYPKDGGQDHEPAKSDCPGRIGTLHVVVIKQQWLRNGRDNRGEPQEDDLDIGLSVCHKISHKTPPFLLVMNIPQPRPARQKVNTIKPAN